MNHQEAREVLQELLDAGVRVEVKSFIPEKYEIQTGAKSNVFVILNEDDRVFIEDRYSGDEEVYSKNQMLDALAHCRYGQSYMNANLAEYLVNQGYMKKIVETTVKYE